jgi:uncharacterized protein (DUF1501 family)
MNITRRILLKQGALALVSVGVAPALGPEFLRRTAMAAEPNRPRNATGGRKILICIFQRGAVDGLSMIVPHGDKDYYRQRDVNGIAIARKGEDAVLDLDGFFGLHPRLAMLKPIYAGGHLAAIQAVGSPNPTRSHFDAQDYMDSALPGDKTARTGWLARTLQNCPEDKTKAESLFKAISMTGQVPRALHGEDALAIPDLDQFGVKDSSLMAMAGGMRRNKINENTSGVTAGFETLYDKAVGDVLHGTGRDTFEALKIVESIKKQPYTPANGADYPNGRYGESLKQVAQLIKADVGVEVAFVESGGWDTHINQGGAEGNLARKLQEFGAGIAALYADLGDRMADVCILTMSEFGRTARQNGNAGTDHGHATCFLALGGNVKGGKVLGQWPGLSQEQLYEGRDLAVTTDFRDVFGEVAQRHMGVRDLKPLFADYQASPTKFRNVLKA